MGWCDRDNFFPRPKKIVQRHAKFALKKEIRTGMSNKIFFQVNKKQVGPYSRRKVRKRLVDKNDDAVTPDSVVWHPGLPEWTALKNILHPHEMEGVQTEEGNLKYTRNNAKALVESVGIGRVGYVLLLGALALVTYLTLYSMERTNDTDLAIYAAVAVVTLIATAYRLRNIGVSGWWILTLPIPPMCLIIPVMGFVAPEHFAETREFDGSSFFAFILLLIGGLLLYMHVSHVG
ncbi:hypothetical protein BH09VER1_BH09VER1_31150 [soil metagenome]